MLFLFPLLATRTFVRWAVHFAVVLPLAIPAMTTAQGNSTLINGSFEQIQAEQPAGWEQQSWGGQAEFSVRSDGRGGGRCVSIQSSDGADAAWRQRATVEPDMRYRLSAWVRTENLHPRSAEGALLHIDGVEGARTRAMQDTSDWTYLETEFFNTASAVMIHCRLGGWGQSAGRVCFDDLSLQKLGPATRSATVRIDTDDTGHKIHPFIYGQFIEHLGRCIYGGIWAQMLEDRKFYFPITADYAPYTSLQHTAYPVVGRSPWEIVGDAAKVAMIKKDSFVGDHTPRLEEGVSIRQHDLGVVQGKQYTGYIWLLSADHNAVVRVSLATGNGRQGRTFTARGSDYEKFDFTFTAGASTDEAVFTIEARQGAVFIGTVSLMPADNVRGMRADTLALLKKLDAPVYRWPGGNFLSGYEWRDGIGDRDRRPPRVNPAWTGVEHNDFGLHEFIDFCRELKTEPMIAANSGFGDAYSAAAQVEYCNGATQSYWGGQRAANGSPEPFEVKWWSVGNEMYGKWQLGFMQLSHYTIKHNLFAKAMLDVDPMLQLIGVGDVMGRYNQYYPDQEGTWAEGMLRQCADTMDLIAEHFYAHGRTRRRQVNPAEHMDLLAQGIRERADAHRELQGRLDNLGERTIPIAMDEWNFWYHEYEYGELGCVYNHADGLAVAVGLHEYYRNSDIIAAANYAQTVNVIGCIKTTRTDAFLSTTALPLMLYRQQYGEIPVAVSHDTEELDVVAAWTPDREAVTVGIVNANWETVQVELAWSGSSPAGKAKAWEIAAPTPGTYNGPGHKEDVVITGPMTLATTSRIEVAPLTNLLVRVPMR